MKAMLTDANRRLVWTDVPDPAVGETQVLIEVEAAALNRADLLQREGKYPSPPGCPPWMGLEVAGRVKAVGARVRRFRVGDAVCALLGGGGYAELVAAEEGMVLPVPRGLTMEEAASLPEAYATCFLNLFIEGQYRPGETLYFPAGASGLASVGVPLAKAFGAFVITSVQKTETAEKIAPLGADVVICEDRENPSEALRREAENGHPIDLAIDCLGGETIGSALPFVREGCRWVLISTLAGTQTTLPLRALLTRGVTLKGSMLRKRSVEEKSDLLRRLEKEVWPLLENRTLRPSIFRVLPVSQAEAAHDLLREGKNVGKVVLKIKG